MIYNTKLIFYYVNDDYIEYLINEIDDKVSYNKADSQQRPYVGFILTIEGISYLVPLSSKIRKSNDITSVIPNIFTESQMKEKDFDTKYPKYIATIKFNCMIPVCDKLIKKINLSEFNFTEEDINYKNLLSKEIIYCNDNKEKIFKNASKTYEMFQKNKPYKADLIKCCFNFPKLEQALITYIKFLNDDNQLL